MRRVAGAVAAALLLAGCGEQQGLTPARGKSLPVKAATSPAAPTADDLLVPTPTARPSRSDELLTKSQPRRDDRFDLPPR